MKNTIIFITVLSISAFTLAQGSSKDGSHENIFLSVFIPETVEGMPEVAVKDLENKLTRIITSNGLGVSNNQRFIVSARVNVLSKNITPTTPTVQAYTLDITLYIGDGLDGKMFSSTSVTVKGVGETDAKAYLSAFSNIKEKSSDFKDFIASGKQKILEYYKSNCDILLKEAKVFVGNNDYEGAIFKLMSVPMASSDCYKRVLDESLVVYKKMIDRDCNISLNKASAIWSSEQSYEAAKKAAEILTSIEPEAACFGEVRALFNSIKNRVLEVDKREWNFKLKDQLQESERIEAVRDIGVAYGKNQQPITVQYKTLW